MFWLLESFNCADLLFLSLFPVIGLALLHFLGKKIMKRVFLVAFILVISSLSSYYILAVEPYKLACLVIVSIIYAHFVADLKWKLGVSLLLTSLFLIASFANIMYRLFSGSYKTTFLCRKGNYKIEKYEYVAFAGRSVPSYKLYYAPLGGLLNKQIEEICPDPFKEAERCQLHFKEGVVYDRCNNKIERYNVGKIK